MFEGYEMAVCPRCHAPKACQVIVVLPFDERVSRVDRRQSDQPHLIPASGDRRKAVRDRRQIDLIAQASASVRPQMECHGCGHLWETAA